MPNYTDVTSNTYLNVAASDPYDKIAELEQHLRETKFELDRMQKKMQHMQLNFRVLMKIISRITTSAKSRYTGQEVGKALPKYSA